ncbi:MAG: CsbD family protein [Rhodoglobus sp.]
MGMDDKIRNAAEETAGRVKEGVGAATDNRDLENEGKVDRAKADLHQAGEKVKDAVKDATN